MFLARLCLHIDVLARRLRLLALAFAPALLGAQGTATGVVQGLVSVRSATDTTTPAPGATVSIDGTRLLAVTAADGRFLLEREPVGSRTVRVVLRGYRTAEQVVTVAADDTARVEFLLEARAQLLAPVLTDARSAETRAFESRPDVGTIAMGAAAIAGVPRVGEPDVVRVVQLLPGVVARNDFNTGLNVRGGEADQNLVLLDGHPIYNPFHLGGLFSTFMDATVGGVELMAGAFPARFGGRLSSVLDVRSAEERRSGVHATADVSALGATGRLAGSVNEGAGTWSIAGRRTYADAVTSLFTDNVFPYHFRDFHGRAAWELGDVRVAITGYAGRDALDANLAAFESDSVESKAGSGEWAFGWGNEVLGASVEKSFDDGVRIPLLGWRIGDDGAFAQRISTSRFSSLLDLGDGALSQRSSVRDLRATGTLVARSAAHDRSFGYEVATHRIRYAAGSSATGTTDFDITQRPVTGALWVEDLWRLSTRWLVQGGLRAEALSTRRWAGLSPRASVKYFVTPVLAVTAGAGHVTQSLHSLAGDGPLRYFDVWLSSDEYTPVASGWHWVGGAERRFGAGSLRLEGYLKRYDRVLEADWSEDPGRRGDELLSTTGTSYGVDLLARWQPGARVAGWASYTWGVSSRSRDGVRWAPGHDRRHDLDIVATWRPSRYRLGARVGYATGTPYTPIVGEIARLSYDPSRDRWGTGKPQRPLESLGGARNGARFPAVHRIDLDASRDFTIRGATVAPYVSVANAINAKNVFVYLYEYSTDRPTRRAISQFPILPSLGVRVDF